MSSPQPPSSEATATELQFTPAQAKKKAKLEADVAALEAELQKVLQEQEQIYQKLKNKNADETVKNHIELLHEFNEVKDVAMGLLGMVAENRGVRLQDIMEEFGVDEMES